MTNQKMRKPLIENLERYGRSGWQWKIKKTKYRTNEVGDGLWIYTTSGASIRTKPSEKYPRGWKPHKEWKQIEGTGQFSLPKDKKKAYNKLYYAYRGYKRNNPNKY